MNLNQFVIVDDHPLYREAIAGVIEDAFPDDEVFEFSTLAEFFFELENGLLPDLLLLDLNMPDTHVLSGLKQVQTKAPDLPVAIISAEESSQVVLQAMALGAVGFIPKSMTRVMMGSVLEQLIAGQLYLPQDLLRVAKPTQAKCSDTINREALAALTKKQLRVLQCLAKGESNKQIADHLNLAESTVKTHVSEILKRLGVQNRVQAANQAQSIDFDSYLSR